MIKNIKHWMKRTFKVIDVDEAVKLKLTHIRNVYGDEINKINCRSIWADNKGRGYRVRQLQY